MVQFVSPCPNYLDIPILLGDPKPASRSTQ